MRTRDVDFVCDDVVRDGGVVGRSIIGALKGSSVPVVQDRRLSRGVVTESAEGSITTTTREVLAVVRNARVGSEVL